MVKNRVTMGTGSFLRAAAREGVIAELRTSDGQTVGLFGRSNSLEGVKPDVIARTVDVDTCEVHGRTIVGDLFLSLAMAGGL